MLLSSHQLALFLSTFTFFFFVIPSLAKEALVEKKNISEDLNSISSRNEITLAKLADLEKRINALTEELSVEKGVLITGKKNSNNPKIDKFLTKPEEDFELTEIQSEDELTDIESEDQAINHSSPPESTISSSTFNYYFSFIFGINFPSNTKLKTLGGIANLDNDVGFGVETEIGRRFGWLKLGLGLGYEKHDLKNLRIINTPIPGKGENSSFKLVLKPGVIFDINEIISVSGGIDLGLVGRKADYSVPSVPYLDSGDSIAFIWGIGFAVSANLNDRHSISLGYAFSDFPDADNFCDLVMHSLEAGYSLSF